MLSYYTLLKFQKNVLNFKNYLRSAYDITTSVMLYSWIWWNSLACLFPFCWHFSRVPCHVAVLFPKEFMMYITFCTIWHSWLFQIQWSITSWNVCRNLKEQLPKEKQKRKTTWFKYVTLPLKIFFSWDGIISQAYLGKYNK